MLKHFTGLLFILSFFINTGFSQQKTYQLLDETTTSDIDLSKMKNISKYNPGIGLVEEVFKIVNGKYTVYRFISTYTGISFNNEEKKFHDFIILKTTEDKKIISAYQYSLDIYDPPSFAAIYKNKAVNIYLKNNLNISDLNFYRPLYKEKRERALNDNGVLKIIKTGATLI